MVPINLWQSELLGKKKKYPVQLFSMTEERKVLQINNTQMCILLQDNNRASCWLRLLQEGVWCFRKQYNTWYYIFTHDCVVKTEVYGRILHSVA